MLIAGFWTHYALVIANTPVRQGEYASSEVTMVVVDERRVDTATRRVTRPFGYGRGKRLCEPSVPSDSSS